MNVTSPGGSAPGKSLVELHIHIIPITRPRRVQQHVGSYLECGLAGSEVGRKDGDEEKGRNAAGIPSHVDSDVWTAAFVDVDMSPGRRKVWLLLQP